MAGQAPSMDQFEAYFQRADLDRDGRISGDEAVAFFQATNLSKQVLAQIWTYADRNRAGFLGRPEFYNALKLVTVAQKRDLTPDIVKAALYSPASAKIPAPQINLAAVPAPQLTAKVVGSPAQVGGTATSTQGIGVSGQHGFSTLQSQVMRPPRPPPPSSGFQPQLGVPTQGVAGAGSISVPHGTSSNALGGSTDGFQTSLPSQVSNRSLTPGHGSFGSTASPITQSKVPAISASLPSASSKTNDAILNSHVASQEPKSLSATGNGFAPDSVSGNAFLVTSSQPKGNPTAHAYPGGTIPASSAGASASSSNQPTFKPTAISQPPAVQPQQSQSMGKVNQHVLTQNSSGYPVAAGNLPSQSQPPWPRMTLSDVQKYSKVFVQVDTDRDGKITGEQARNLFLSWRLPREILKQVWDLSDQDNDSMLSLREFCTALYLMERYREGRPLPTVLPNSLIFHETLLPGPVQPGAASTSWRPTPGFRQPHGTKNARPITNAGVGKPPRPVPIPQPEEPVQQKPKVPVLEKHLLEQLSSEEQDSLNKKFQEAKDAEKKVADLEKDILEAKQKIQFYHAKMQELILYKSRCDNRLNEITEKVVTDKREAELLAKKYEEKYKQAGDVASKLTIEEATFRDIQEKKMELYRAIVKLEQDKPDGIQDRANQIQSDLEELVIALNERCKTYGLRGKPTSLVELPFGWQPGIEVAAADWDEDWDKFEDEGFTYVKELTLEVQNVIAPPKPKSALIREKVTSLDNSSTVKSTSKAGDNSEVQSSEERVPERSARSPPDSPAGNNNVESPSKEFRDLNLKDINVNGSPRFDTQSEFGAESVLSGDRGFDEAGWGSSDTHYDADAAWDFNSTTPKAAEREDSLFSADGWGLAPIRTGPPATDTSFPKQGPLFDSVPSTPLYASTPHAAEMSLPRQGPFFDSVPSTPLYASTPHAAETSLPKQGPFFDSVPSTPLYASTPHADNMFTRNSPFPFADSVPSTPMHNYSPSPRMFNEGSEEQYTFDSFSRFDSFNSRDNGPSFSRFDSMRSTRDSDFDQGRDSMARFDSFRSTADSDYNFGAFPPRETFSRFDSMRSTRDSDHGHSSPSFDDGADPFGSSEPFKTSREAETPRKDSDSWKAF